MSTQWRGRATTSTESVLEMYGNGLDANDFADQLGEVMRRRVTPDLRVASHLINTGPHLTCRRWAHAIAVHPQAVDGLLYSSSMTGSDAAALFLPAADTFPRHPRLSLPLNDPGLAGVIEAAAGRIGYIVR